MSEQLQGIDTTALNQELKAFFKDADRYKPIKIDIELTDKDAMAYRIAHLLLRYGTRESEATINSQLFMIGLNRIDTKMRNLMLVTRCD